MVLTAKMVAWAAVILTAVSVSADECNIRLTAREAKAIFFPVSNKTFAPLSFTGTPLEMSASLRKWKTDLAQKLQVDPQAITGSFSRELPSPEENSGAIRLLLVRTTQGVRALVMKEFDLELGRLSYYDPSFPVKTFVTSATIYSCEGKACLMIEAARDPHDQTGTTGTTIGTLTVNIPGFSL